MTRSSDSPKERLRRALDELGTDRSVMDVGINELLTRAGVAKASLYQHYPSKEALLTDWLERRQERWFGWFDEFVAARAQPGDARSEIRAAFGFLAHWLSRDDFAGCPFLSVGLHVRDLEAPVFSVANAYAMRLRRFFADRLSGSKQSDSRASTLLSLYLGAVTLRQMGVDLLAGEHAARTASALLDAWLGED